MKKHVLDLRQSYENSLIKHQKIITVRNYYFSYTCGLSYELLNIMDQVDNPNSFQLLFKICSQLKFSNQSIDENDVYNIEIIIKRLEFSLDKGKWSRSTFYRAIKPLLENDIIIRKGYSYMANPFYFNILSSKQYEMFRKIIFKI